ncbi:GatB/YqeY domain-containing protein [bacterium]|nr:GatB/YqeY domain-containing protein [bacterium]
MDLEQQVSELLKDAMKSGDKPRLTALRSIKSVLTNERTRHSGPLPEDDAFKVVASHRKKMDGAREQYADAGRDDMARQAELEIEVCDQLLPERLSDEQLEAVVQSTITEVGAAGPGDIGKVMGPVMQKYGSQVEGDKVKELVMRVLRGS